MWFPAGPSVSPSVSRGLIPQLQNARRFGIDLTQQLGEQLCCFGGLLVFVLVFINVFLFYFLVFFFGVCVFLLFCLNVFLVVVFGVLFVFFSKCFLFFLVGFG